MTTANSNTTRNRYLFATLSAGIFLLLALGVLVKILHANGHHFSYVIDDPYIHLALARGIAEGHYGINPGEPSSPSSSILWPLLLVPFARFSFFADVPLAINLVCGFFTSLLIGWSVGGWPAGDQPRSEPLRRGISVLGLLLAGNVVGLVFVGMEHSLEALLAATIACALIDCLRGQPPSRWATAAAILAPSVRYECLTLTVALAVALIGLRRYRQAAFLGVSVVPLLAFGLYLRHLGLPMLPMSVILKGGGKGLHGMAAIAFQVNRFVGEAHVNQQVQLLGLLAGTLAGIAAADTVRARRFAFAGAAIAAGLHTVLGPFGWFSRYEVSMFLFALLIVLYRIHERPRMLFGWYAICLAVFVLPPLAHLEQTPHAAHEVYGQQWQTSRFLSDVFHGNIATGDIGVVAMRHRPGQYVLDFVGLASPEVFGIEGRPYLDKAELIREHKIDLVAIYWDGSSALSPGWEPVGSICLPGGDTVAVWKPCVYYVATSPAVAPALRTAFAGFIPTLPPGDTGTVIDAPKP